MRPKTKCWMGIDPGQGGAVAIIAENGGVVVSDWPGDEIATSQLIKGVYLENFDIRLCALEMVSAMPKQGVSSMFKFGANWGIWRGILAALEIPFIMVRPQEWQKNLVPKKAESTDKPSLIVARRMFPSIDLRHKKDHGRADSLLLALYAKGKA